MTKDQVKTLLAGLFTTRKAAYNPDEDVIIFSSEYMDSNNLGTPLDENKHAIYEAVSQAMYDSGLTHDFSYEIASRAVGALLSVDDWTEDGTDALMEAIDGEVPIYNNELTEIYRFNSWAVDDAAEEYGAEGDSISRAARAWYAQISSMISAIQANLKKLIDEE